MPEDAMNQPSTTGDEQGEGGRTRTFDQALFDKVASRLGSEERETALRVANGMLDQADLSWAEVLAGRRSDGLVLRPALAAMPSMDPCGFAVALSLGTALAAYWAWSSVVLAVIAYAIARFATSVSKRMAANRWRTVRGLPPLDD